MLPTRFGTSVIWACKLESCRSAAGAMLTGGITGEATKIEEGVTARTYPLVPADGEASVFQYEDTATSRAGIGAVNARIAGQRLGIVGLGGTGSYTRNLATGKTRAAIHAYDSHGLVHAARMRAQARNDLIERWDRDRQAGP